MSSSRTSAARGPAVRSRRPLASGAVLALGATLLAACAGQTGGAEAEQNSDVPHGTITHLTHLDPARFEPYVQAFEEKYPEVEEVRVERLTDYGTEIKTRMSTEDYGDVLNVQGVSPDQLPDFFEPLGAYDELSQDYRWLTKTYEGTTYAIPDLGNAWGFLYNKQVWADAGIEDWPTTTDEFLADLQTIKDSAPDVTPLVTNYKDGWMLSQWEGYRGLVSLNPDIAYDMSTWDDPWGSGNDYEIIDGLLYDLAAEELIEADPTTATYDETKIKIGSGEIATMPVASWAITRAGGDIEKAGLDPSVLGYMPFPVQHDGEFYTTTGPDISLGINVHSENKVTARAWLDFLADESSYSADMGGLSPRKDGPEPEVLADFLAGVQIFEPALPPAGEEARYDEVSTTSGIITTDGRYRQELVDAARTGSQTKEEAFAELNEAWAKGVASVG
ncbi:ABC transporter substrate-binding protein [Promicromonospora sukumoe]